MKRIYADYAAATPLESSVEREMQKYAGIIYGNPSSLHTEGRRAKKAVERARKTIADILGICADEILFTGSGTESAALALYGVMAQFPSAHMVTSAEEHAAVLANARALQQKGISVSLAPSNAQGIVDKKALQDALRPQTTLVSILYVHNETGAVNPLRAIARIVRKERTRRRNAGELLPLYFHTDACQAAELFPLAVPQLGVDLMTLNASKIYGPKGIGLLYKRRGIPLEPLWRGGGQEQGLRSGTENVSGIMGFAKALQLAEQKKKREYARLTRLQAMFIRELQKAIPHLQVNGPPLGENRSPGNIHISIPGIEPELLALYLDKKGIAASTGSACDALREPLPAEKTREGIRLTLGRNFMLRDAFYTIEALRGIVTLLKKSPKQPMVQS
jgi:cysteine desulfurase